MEQLAQMRAMLASIKVQVDLMLQLLDVEDLMQVDKGCRHAHGKRIDLSTFGNEKWKCGECGYVYDDRKSTESVVGLPEPSQ